MNIKFNLDEFLNKREERVEFQKEMCQRNNSSLLVLRANYPGENKNNFFSLSILKEIRKEILSIFNRDIIEENSFKSLEGDTFIFSIDLKADFIKKIAMEIEDSHILGRCVDIDVFDSNYIGISRVDLGKEKRKCLICNEMAFICARLQNHSLEALKNSIEEKYNTFLEFQNKSLKLADFYSNLALKSIILEVSSRYSFGLVSPFTQGSHKDMDFFTFIDSGFSLTPYLKEFFITGYSPFSLEYIFRKIRYIGIQAEISMFKTTKNVNTHKGMIFLIGITLACLGKTLYDNKKILETEKNIKEMCTHILDDFINIEKKENLTHGEKLFLEFGVTGVRGLVKNGLNIVFEKGITVFSEAFSQFKDMDIAMGKTLLFYMSEIDDTTILYRHNFETLKYVKNLSKELYTNFETSKSFYNKLEIIEKTFIEKNISPGGSADLLAITIFLYFSQLI